MIETQNSQPEPRGSFPRTAFSLRTKIILGNLLIVLIAVAAMGYFVFARSQAANEFLVEQFDISVAREIENRLKIVTSNEVSDISIFFSSMKSVIDTFGTTTGAFIEHHDAAFIPEESDWNAYNKLSRLPSGNWDNANEELASIFLPANMNINDNLARELSALKNLDYYSQGLLEDNPDIIAIYFGGALGETVYYPNIDLATLVPPDFDITSRPWYVNAAGLAETDKKAVWSVPYQDAALHGLVITSSVPIFDNRGIFRGVAGIDVQLATITDRISSLSIGKTGYGFLIDSAGRVIAMPSKGYADFNLTEEEIQAGDIDNLKLTNRVSLDIFEVLAKMISGQNGVRRIDIQNSSRYIAFRPIPIVGYSLGIVVSEDELLQEVVRTNTILEAETRQTIVNALGIIFILLSVAGLASYGIGNSITAPLGKLTKVAEKVADGDLDIRAEVQTGDEIGILGGALNSMTSTAQELVLNLEGVVAERTQAVARRAAQIQAVAEVGQAVAAQRNLEELLLRASHLISNRFGYYHVGIFLLDTRSEYATLRAANSSGGTQMLARGHKLKVGTEGIVGAVTGSGEARIVLDVGEDAVYFNNPDLPQTHSEMALPLIAGGEILGALDIQSVDADAFSEVDIPILQVLADQLSTAVQNARLLRDTREALISARKATSDISHQSWSTILQEIKKPGYIGMIHGEMLQANEELPPETKALLDNGEVVISPDARTVSVPIAPRGQTIGMMRLVKPSHAEPWTSEEIALIEALSNRIGNTLDSARLFEEIQQRAAHERIIGEMTTKISATTNIDAIMRSTVQELGHQLGGAEIILELEPDQELPGAQHEF